jgi:hypothetical protein
MGPLKPLEMVAPKKEPNYFVLVVILNNFSTRKNFHLFSIPKLFFFAFKLLNDPLLSKLFSFVYTKLKKSFGSFQENDG